MITASETIMRLMRLLPLGMPGKTRLARSLITKSIQGISDLYIKDRYGSTFLAPNLYDTTAFYLFIDGLIEPEVTKILTRHLKPGMVFLDVGANIGFFSALAGKRVGKIGRVIAVEPSPRIFSYLQRNMHSNNLSNVALENSAAFEENVEKVPFYEAPTEKFSMGALAPQFHDKPIMVKAVRLDSILLKYGIDHVDILKLDTEGAEARVLNGAKNLLTGERPPLVIFEFNDWAEARMRNLKVGDSQRILRSYGYSLWKARDFINGPKKPLKDIVTRGFDMLVAAKQIT